jgi:hypothetical protein
MPLKNPLMMYQPSPSTVIALNLSEENNRVDERADALINLEESIESCNSCSFSRSGASSTLVF